MKMQLLASSGILAVVMTLTVMASSSLDAQGTPRATSAASGDRSALPRTPWGHADLQGTWTSEGELGVPFERPTQFGERQHLTDAEYADRLQQTRVRDEEALAEIDVFTADVSNAGAVGSPTSPPPHWLERSTQSRRTFAGDRPTERPDSGADTSANARRRRRASRWRSRPVSQQRRRLQSLRPMHHARPAGRDLSSYLQCEYAHRPGTGRRGHHLRDDPRDASRFPGRPHPAAGIPPDARQFARALGG